MTGLVHPPTDDLAGTASLRPLDFTNLLAYSQDPILPSASISPAVWPTGFSPLCSATSRLAPAPAALGADPAGSLSNLNDATAWLGPLSPLFKPSPTLTSSVQMTDALLPPLSQKDNNVSIVDSETVSTAVWGSSVAQSSTAPTVSEVQSVPIQFAAPIQPATAFTADNLDMGMMDKVPEVLEVHTEPSTSPSVHSTGTLSPSSGSPVPEMGKVKEVKGGGKSGMTRKVSQTMSSIDKAAERRRKNRESSSRCYYNRKRIIENLDKEISKEKSKLTALYDRALELRHENARLKKDVVTNGIALPTKPRTTYRSDNALQLQGYLQLLQSASFQCRQ